MNIKRRLIEYSGSMVGKTEERKLRASSEEFQTAVERVI